MTDDGKDNSVVISWRDFQDSVNADKDPASLLKPLSESERKIVYERLNQPLAPNVANSTMFIMLSENSSDPHFIKDSSFKYIYVNKAMANLFKRPVKDIIGLKDEQLFSPEEVGPMISATCRTLRGGIVRERNDRTIDGVPRTFIDTLVPWRNDSGEIVAIYGTSVDITDDTESALIFDVDKDESRSEVMRGTLHQIHTIAKSETTVLLLGESGVGKDHLARYIHDHSDRRGAPFQGVNCAALAKDLIESELFGHEKGAFTGAGERKRGLVELADKGTLFLNEIAELPLALQAKLLSFLDREPFKRVGGEKNITVDVRIIAATNKNLEQEIKLGTFRADLYYRLNVLAITVPPLRDRMEDIPILTKALVDKIAMRLKIPTPTTIPVSFVAVLRKSHWPGNVRELGNVIEKALILANAKRLPLDARFVDLPTVPSESIDGSREGLGDPRPAPPFGDAPVRRREKPSDEELLGLFEDYINAQGWTRARLAKEVLGVDESTAKKWLKAAGAPAGKKGRRPKTASPIENEPDKVSSKPSSE